MEGLHVNLNFGPDIFPLKIFWAINSAYLYITFAPFVCQFNHFVTIADNQRIATLRYSRRGLLHDPAAPFNLLFFLFVSSSRLFLWRSAPSVHVLRVEVVLVLVDVHLRVTKLSIHGYYTCKVKIHRSR